LAAEVAEPPRHAHLGWILSVPDTHQRTVLAALDKEQAIRVLTCATEDEATTIAAGLWMGGEPSVLMIQHAGLYASVNTLRGVAIDGRVPAFYMIGLLSREKDTDPRESRHSMVRYCEPLLDTFGVPHARAGRPLGHVRGLHGRRLVARARAGARAPRPPRDRLRRGRLAPHAARLAGDDRRRPAPEPHPPRLQERRLPHVGRTGHSRRLDRGLRADGE